MLFFFMIFLQTISLIASSTDTRSVVVASMISQSAVSVAGGGAAMGAYNGQDPLRRRVLPVARKKPCEQIRRKRNSCIRSACNHIKNDESKAREVIIESEMVEVSRILMRSELLNSSMETVEPENFDENYLVFILPSAEDCDVSGSASRLDAQILYQRDQQDPEFLDSNQSRSVYDSLLLQEPEKFFRK